MKVKTDTELQSEVFCELKWDGRLTNSGIGVEVKGGLVTLLGEVSSYAKKLAAQEAAHRVAGVLDVANEIKVKPLGSSFRSDEALARAVRHSLEWDAFVPDEQITSTVANGWVTLEGNVGCWAERDDAEAVVRRLQGVIGVTNNIKLPEIKVDVSALRAEIEEALERRADREAERFRIELVDDNVNLFGRVHSWQEKRAVLGSIKNHPGVGAVHDFLRIEPYF